MFRLLLLISFIESFATILFERGIYFFTHDILRFSDAGNLWLALVFGVVYVAGALGSHALSRGRRERAVLLGAVLAQIAVNAALAHWPVPACMFVGAAALGALNGIKWPIIESYISAGHAPLETARRIGAFNVSWSLAVPFSLAVVGPLLADYPVRIFWLAGAINLASAALVLALPAAPAYLDGHHPDADAPANLPRWGRLLVASRWLLLMSYSLMWILAALFPGIFDRLQAGASGPALSGLLDVVRMGAFLVLGFWAGWHNRRWPIVAGAVALPLGFLLAVSGASLPAVLVGELVFGASAGIVYYAAIYYAMLVENASVSAGGGHEGLIGLGFAIGPAAGLAGAALHAHGFAASAFWGTLLGAAPVLLVCLTGAARALATTTPRPKK